MGKDMGLYRALDIVRKDALEQEEYWKTQIEKKPLHGWTKEKHIRYCQVYQSNAQVAAHYLFIRMMQINLD